MKGRVVGDVAGYVDGGAVVDGATVVEGAIVVDVLELDTSVGIVVVEVAASASGGVGSVGGTAGSVAGTAGSHCTRNTLCLTSAPMDPSALTVSLM